MIHNGHIMLDQIKPILWVTWEDQRRNESMAREINARLFNFNLNHHPKPVKYIIGGWKTFLLLLKERPTVVIVQNPSFMLALCAVLVKPLFNYTLGVDTHNSGFGLDRDSHWFHRILSYIQTRSDFIIVHNDMLHDIIKEKCAASISLPDPVPKIPEKARLTLKGERNILFVCTYKKDEPFERVIEGARLLPDHFHVYISGNYRGKVNTETVPENVTLLGWVSRGLYNALLHSVDAVVALTTREYCLLCGGYETVAVKKPLITSNTRTLKTYFPKGTVYTGHAPDDIADAIKYAVNNRSVLSSDMSDFHDEIDKIWQARKLRLLELISAKRGIKI